jgi:hypothetical protein
MEALLRRVVVALRFPAGAIALAGVALSVWVHIASLRGIDVESAWPSVWVLHYALFPIILLATLTGLVATGRKRPSLRAFLGIVPAPALLLLGAAFVYVIATFAVAPPGGAGDPVITDGHFYFNDHGIMREVDEHEFHLQRSASLRRYSGVWVYLYLFSAIYLLGVQPLASKLG